MNDVDLYLDALTPERKEKLESVIDYIKKKYPYLQLSCDYGPKTKFPVFKTPDLRNYVGIASQKSTITIHFGNYNCPAIVLKADKRIKTGVGCAKIPDTVPFPLENIKKAIDLCIGDGIDEI
jgi:hypothetical protein